jgi:hypothetical protein
MAFPYPYAGPIALLNNLPIEPQYYSPNFNFISNIALGQVTTVTTTVNTEFVIGQLCRLIIPPTYGCRQLNNVTGYVLSLPTPTTIVLDINSSQNVDAFTASSVSNQPQILPVGDVNTGAINAQGRVNNGTFIPGSFINVSPN